MLTDGPWTDDGTMYDKQIDDAGMLDGLWATLTSFMLP